MCPVCRRRRRFLISWRRHAPASRKWKTSSTSWTWRPAPTCWTYPTTRRWRRCPTTSGANWANRPARKCAPWSPTSWNYSSRAAFKPRPSVLRRSRLSATLRSPLNDHRIADFSHLPALLRKRRIQLGFGTSVGSVTVDGGGVVRSWQSFNQEAVARVRLTRLVRFFHIFSEVK